MKEMQTFDYNFILLYISNKGEQPNEDYKLLNDQDLLLVIETEFQKDMLLKHGAIVVCIWIQPTMLVIIIFI